MRSFKRHSSDDNNQREKYLLDIQVSETLTQTWILRKTESGETWLASKGPSWIPIANGSKTPEEVAHEYSQYIKKEWEEDLKRMDFNW